ncbi:MAG: hypothetical protein HY902_17320 [Deltaproteobacteria bacterium]|nr:hypothetical protein [Deltaproteobacteria bacterium]
MITVVAWTALALLPGCPQALPSSGQFGGDTAATGADGSISGGQDIAATGDSSGATDAATGDSGGGGGTTLDASGDVASGDQQGGETTSEVCACATNPDCASIAVGTCQVVECQKCQCIVVVAADGSPCGAGNECKSGACLPKSVPGAWAVGIAAGGNHSCALRGNGTLSCWGANGEGQLGNGTTSGPLYYEKIPQEVAMLTKVSSVELGDTHSCAVWGGGKLSCWGDRFSGKTGSGDNSGSATTPESAGTITDALAVTCGNQNGLAIRAGLTLWGWGGNSGNAFLTGDFTQKNSPVLVQGVLGSSAVCAGSSHVCALAASDGTVRCWGRSGDGEVGNGKIGDLNEVYPPSDVGLTGIVGLACGDYHTCGWDAAGKLCCLGKNLSSQLGLGAYSAGAAVPVATKSISDVKAVAGGQGHTCAVTKAGAVLCWGSNDDGQAGQIASSADINFPTAVDIGGKSLGVACGTNHSCAVRDDGAVLCWGRNSNGQLGNNSTSSGGTPVLVVGSK